LEKELDLAGFRVILFAKTTTSGVPASSRLRYKSEGRRMLEFNRNQKIVIGLAMLALVVMVLFPPWYPHRGQGQLGEHYAPIWCGARLLGNVPRQRDTNYSMSTRRPPVLGPLGFTFFAFA
jgi:hypothetical protein